MNEWVTQQVPAFALVGRVNVGKSSVLATLLEIDDNDVIRISSTPGETTGCQIHHISVSGRENLRFLDTPGFQQPIAAKRAIEALAAPGTPDLSTLRRFATECRREFPDEVRLLDPILQNAGILYIVDPAVPLVDDFRAEIEILRWTGRPRLALLNLRGGSPSPHEEQWRQLLGSAFNLTRSFDAHHARFHERLHLLRALLEIEERHRPMLEETIRGLENDWITRREQSAELIQAFLADALTLHLSAPLEPRDEALPANKKRKEEELRRKYLHKLATLEEKVARDLLRLYKHHLPDAGSAPADFDGIDLLHEETWRKWGLTRAQLAATGAAAGAGAGLALDAATGFFSHGIFTAIGTMGGGTAAWFKGGSLPEFTFTIAGAKLRSNDGKSISISAPKGGNLPWVLLDSVLARYSAILASAHGRRGKTLAQTQTNGSPFSRGFPADRRKALARWFDETPKGSPSPEVSSAALRHLIHCLEEIGKT